MFVDMMIFLILVSAGFEMYVAFKIPPYLHAVEKYPLIAVFVSITLSWYLGKMFGATGLIALSGGLGSTMVTLVCYRGLAKYHDGTIQAKLDKYQKDLQSAKQLARDVGRVIYIILRIVTAPIWMYRDGKEWVTQQKAKFTHT